MGRTGGGFRSPGARGALTVANVVSWVGQRARDVRWYVTSLMGDRAYSIYVDHLVFEHPEQAPMNEAAFWTQRYRDQESNPGSRCC